MILHFPQLLFVYPWQTNPHHTNKKYSTDINSSPGKPRMAINNTVTGLMGRWIPQYSPTMLIKHKITTDSIEFINSFIITCTGAVARRAIRKINAMAKNTNNTVSVWICGITRPPGNQVCFILCRRSGNYVSEWGYFHSSALRFLPAAINIHTAVPPP